jgi:hypothetical protein
MIRFIQTPIGFKARKAMLRLAGDSSTVRCKESKEFRREHPSLTYGEQSKRLCHGGATLRSLLKDFPNLTTT